MKIAIASILSGVTSAAVAAPATLQPGPTPGKDTWIYAFNPVRNTNYNGNGFQNVLATSKAVINSQNHEIRSLIQFDLTGQSVALDETAQLRLYVTNAEPFSSSIANSTPTAPITVDLFPITASWDEGTGSASNVAISPGVTWNNQPTFSSTAVASATISGINAWATFDVTSAVTNWIADPSTNFGFMLVQRANLIDPNQGNRQVAAAFIASDNPAATLRPILQIVPEPTTLAAFAFISAGLMSRRRRG
jgi:hypothetical protein